ncbi:MAG: hypothetical protein RID91_16670, partial [Azospirillaceae bacterium]
RGGGLFRRVTGLLGGEEEEEAPARAPAQAAGRRPTPPQPHQPRREQPQSGNGGHGHAPARQETGGQASQPRLAGVDGGRPPLPKHEDESLDIPAFLRRQAN